MDGVHVQERANQWRRTAKMKKIISMNNISLFDFLEKKSMVILPYNDKDHLHITARSSAARAESSPQTPSRL